MSTSVTTGFARTSDGMKLYYRCLGDQGPVMLCCNGVGVSTFFWKYISLHFRRHFRVVLWDYRGHGLSSMPRDIAGADWSMPRNAADGYAVLDALGIDEPVTLLGHSMGCQVIFEMHVQAPERVAALVPMFGTVGRALDTFMDFPRSRQIFAVVNQVAALGGRSSFRYLLPLYASPLAFAFSRVTGLVDRYDAAKVDIDHYLDHLGHMDPRVFLAMLGRMDDHDLTDHLPDVHVPTLVFGGENDLFTPLYCSERMAEAIPDAELTVLAAGSHAAIVEHPETINLRLERFFAERLGYEI